MAEEFKAGDIVCLKSGGPKMTVTQVGTRAMTGEEAVWCVWFEGGKKRKIPFRLTLLTNGN